MGIIKKQAYAGTVLSYLGVVIGYITTGILFPRFLTPAEIGLLAVFLSYAYIFAQLATLGTGRITIAVFPFFRNKDKNHQGFFPLMILISLVGLVIALIVIFFMKSWLISNSHDQSTLFGQYFNYIFPLIVFTFLFLMLDSFNTTLFNAVRGIFLKEFLQRVLILISVSFYALAIIRFHDFVGLFVLAVGIPSFVLMYYVARNRDFSLKPAFGPMVREKGRLMINIGVNGIIIGFSGMVILVIDRIMVERIMGLGPTGIYTTLAYFATLVAIPSRALLKISDPIIAKSWKENDLQGLFDNYYRSSLNQFLIGSLIMVGLWGNIGNILRILPPAYADGKFVVLFIGLAFLSDMLTGTATYILANSKYIRYQTYYIVILVVLIIITNIILIPIWGLTGAAIATLSSKLISNMIRHQILYRKFNLQPYNAKYLIIILITAISYTAQYFISEISNFYLDIAIRSAIMTVVFTALALGLGISPEVNERFRWALNKVLKNSNDRQT
jgi:O-antigen/teichoic acid export membrane protein